MTASHPFEPARPHDSLCKVCGARWFAHKEGQLAQSIAPLSNTELRRIAEEFQSERDAAKRDAMRAFDERNIALAENAQLRRAETRWINAIVDLATRGHGVRRPAWLVAVIVAATRHKAAKPKQESRK